jgi:hypothetical protein
MTRITRTLALVCLSALAALSIGVPAALAAAVTPWESVAFNVNTDTNSPMLIVSGTLPEKTPLPATVELAVPMGSTLQWAGEILGGDPSADPKVSPTKTQRDGQEIYTFTLTKSHIAQLEVSTQAPVTFDGTVYTVDFKQPVWTDLPGVGIAVQIPQTAQLSETPTGSAGLAPGPTGFQYYQQDFTKVKKGTVLEAKFSYTLGTGGAAGSAGAAGSTGTSSLAIPILLVGIAAALGVALIIGVRRKLSGGSADEDYDDFEDDDAEDVPAPPVSAKAATKKATKTVVVEEVEEAPAKPRNNIALIGTVAIVALALIAGVVAASQGGKAKNTGGAISKTFASGEACTNSTIALAFPEGTDTAKAAEELFAALAVVPSVTAATIQLDVPSIKIGFCESQANEDMIRQALAPTGYVVAGGATTPSTDASGSAPASGTGN